MSCAVICTLGFIDNYCSDEPFEASADEYPIKSAICLSGMIDSTVEILHSAQEEIQGFIDTNETALAQIRHASEEDLF